MRTKAPSKNALDRKPWPTGNGSEGVMDLEKKRLIGAGSAQVGQYPSAHLPIGLPGPVFPGRRPED